MTVIRLEDDALWLHSPNALDVELRTQLDALGEVRLVVAPNLYHDAHLEGYLRAYPRAKLYAAPGLSTKRPDLACEATLDEGAKLPWTNQIDTLLVQGMPQLNESVFFHRASATLLVADLLFCFGAEDPWLTRLMARLDGTYGGPSVSRHARWKLIDDQQAFDRSVERVCSWPVERLLMAHAQVVVSTSGEQLRRTLIPSLS